MQVFIEKKSLMKKFIKQRLNEELNKYQSMRFNDGSLNKTGSNTIYLGDNPIVTFGIGKLGDVTIDNKVYPNSIYLQGGYNASEQGKGYGTLGIEFIFSKLPKIENIILQCFDTACPFWKKIGGVEISNKVMPGNHYLRTLVITRNSFKN